MEYVDIPSRPESFMWAGQILVIMAAWVTCYGILHSQVFERPQVLTVGYFEA